MKRLHEEKIDDAKYYEKIWALEWNQRPWFDAVRMRALLKHLKNNHSLLDVGAGVYGAAQYAAQELHTHATLTAVDQSYTARDLVQQVCPQIDFIIAEFEEGLPFDDDSFDCVTAGEIIEHMEDPARFARELIRVCKPRGWVTISTVNPHCENAIKHGDYPEHLWEFTPDELVEFFAPRASFKYVGDYMFIERRK